MQMIHSEVTRLRTCRTATPCSHDSRRKGKVKRSRDSGVLCVVQIAETDRGYRSLSLHHLWEELRVQSKTADWATAASRRALPRELGHRSAHVRGSNTKRGRDSKDVTTTAHCQSEVFPIWSSPNPISRLVRSIRLSIAWLFLTWFSLFLRVTSTNCGRGWCQEQMSSPAAPANQRTCS
jgi:hypothetical protein